MNRMTIWNWLRWHVARFQSFWTEPIGHEQSNIQGRYRSQNDHKGEKRIGPTWKEEATHG